MEQRSCSTFQMIGNLVLNLNKNSCHALALALLGGRFLRFNDIIDIEKDSASFFTTCYRVFLIFSLVFSIGLGSYHQCDIAAPLALGQLYEQAPACFCCSGHQT